MTDQPLQPFTSSPASLLSFLPAGFSAGIAVTWLLYAVFAFWALYTLVAVYHWLKYSHGSLVAFPAIAVHLFVSVALISYALGGSGLFFASYLP
jgi:hypothetical protein